MIELGFELKSIDLRCSLFFSFDTVHDAVGGKFGAVVEQGEVQMICEWCSRTAVQYDSHQLRMVI